MDSDTITQKPLVAGWSLTNRCNLACLHCYNASGKRAKDEIDTEDALMIIGKLKQAGVKAVNFGGGECCLRDDFITICERLHVCGIKISYTTNGTLLKRISPYLHLFHDIGVSIDFADEDMHDFFRAKAGTYKKALHTIRHLVNHGVNTEIVTCLTKLNCTEEHLHKLYSLAKSLKVDYWRLNRFRPNGRGITNKDDLALSKEDLKNAYTYLSKLTSSSLSMPDPIFRAAFGGAYSIDGDPSGQTAFRIQSNGDVTPSVYLKLSGGNIKDDSIGDILKSDVFRSITHRTPMGKCKTCPSYGNCEGGDAASSYLEYGHFNGPDPYCWLDGQDERIGSHKNMPEDWNVHEMYLCTVYIPIAHEAIAHESA